MSESDDLVWLDDLEVAERHADRYSAPPAGAFLARPIPPESWLNERRFDRLRYALRYAGNKSVSVPALSAIEPEAAAHLFLVMLRGWDRFAYHEAPGARGCSCGRADYGAPGHDGDPNSSEHTPTDTNGTNT